MATPPELEKAWTEYGHKVEAYAHKRFNAVIKPWLDKHGYTFRCLPAWGSAIWDSQGRPIDMDSIPMRIQNVLNIPVPGDDINSLEVYMPDYPPRKEKNNAENT